MYDIPFPCPPELRFFLFFFFSLIFLDSEDCYALGCFLWLSNGSHIQTNSFIIKLVASKAIIWPTRRALLLLLPSMVICVLFQCLPPTPMDHKTRWRHSSSTQPMARLCEQSEHPNRGWDTWPHTRGVETSWVTFSDQLISPSLAPFLSYFIFIAICLLSPRGDSED